MKKLGHLHFQRFRVFKDNMKRRAPRHATSHTSYYSLTRKSTGSSSTENHIYFLALAASSALSLALFSRTPARRASLRASRRRRKAASSPLGSESRLISVTASAAEMFLMGRVELMLVAKPWVLPSAAKAAWAALTSSAEESSFLN